MTAEKKASFLKKSAVLPFFIPLLAVYPVLFLLASNLNQTPVNSAGISLLVSFVIVGLITAVCLVLFRPWLRAYLAALVLSLAFLAYGHLFNLIDARSIGGFLVGRHMVFFPIYVLVFAGLLLAVLKRPLPGQSPVPVLNLVLLALCLFQIIPILTNLVSTGQLAQSEPETSVVQASRAGVGAGPDIYYIVLDGLSREDVIRRQFGYTEYNLPEELERRGFIVPDCAFSNYGTTSTSMSSALNLNYLDVLGVEDEAINTEVDDPPVLYNLFHQNRLVAYLKERGYTFISFRGFFPLNDFKEADIYFNYFENQQGFDNLAEHNFRSMFLRTTLLRLPFELYEGRPEVFSFLPPSLVKIITPDAGVFSSRSYQWYQQHLYSFEKLESVPTLPGQKFTLAHFYSTHQPYVFQPDGRLLWPINEDNDGYTAAVQYTSARILEVVDRILAESKTPPVIIIQADHGQDSGLDRHKILNAYYLPGMDQNLIYSTITPVNSFRVVLNHYFGGDFNLLPDVLMISGAESSRFIRKPSDCGLQ